MPSAPRSLTPRPGAVAALALAAALTASACGEPASPTPSPTGTPAGTSTEAGDAASATALRRSGGLAGFDDRLAVAPDGRVTGTTRTASVDCAVAAQTVETLATAPAPSVAAAAGADRMTVTLLRDDGTVDLGEAQGGDPLSTTARALLDDVQLPPDQRTVCR
ncbi:MAG TPA: hypothetical protein VNN23_09090 [Ornithinibacter sp.]|nr:hypothetical protein [Ornithinibacter sp.]